MASITTNDNHTYSTFNKTFECGKVLQASDLNTINGNVNGILLYINENEEAWRKDETGEGGGDDLPVTPPLNGEDGLSFYNCYAGFTRQEDADTNYSQICDVASYPPSLKWSPSSNTTIQNDEMLFMITAQCKGNAENPNNWQRYNGHIWQGPYRIGSSNTTSDTGADDDKYNYIYCRTTTIGSNGEFPINITGIDWDALVKAIERELDDTLEENSNTEENPITNDPNDEEINVDENSDNSDHPNRIRKATVNGIEWTDHPQGITPTYKYEWEVGFTKQDDTYIYNYGPICISAFGKTGRDGDGVEYIYYLAAVGENAPTLRPTYSGKIGLNGSTTYTNVTVDSDEYLNDDFIPTGWNDDPQQYNSLYPIQYVSVRKRIWNDNDEVGEWQAFSEPVKWNEYVDRSSSGGFRLALTNDNILVDDDINSDGLEYASKNNIQIWDDNNNDITQDTTRTEKITVSLNFNSNDNNLKSKLEPCIVTWSSDPNYPDDIVPVMIKGQDLTGWNKEYELPVNGFEGFCLSAVNQSTFNKSSNSSDLTKGTYGTVTYTVRLYEGNSVSKVLVKELSLSVLNYSEGESYSLLVTPNTVGICRSDPTDNTSAYTYRQNESSFTIKAIKIKGKTIENVSLSSKPQSMSDSDIGELYVEIKSNNGTTLKQVNGDILSLSNGIATCNLSNVTSIDSNDTQVVLTDNVKSYEVELYLIYRDNSNTITSIKVDTETVDFSIKGDKGADGDGVRGSFKSMVFCRVTGNADIGTSTYRPTGGDYDHPWPGEESPHTYTYNSGAVLSITWYDGIPSGEGAIWSSVKTFYDVVGMISEWSIPVKECDTDGLDIEFNPTDSVNPPNPPSGNTIHADHSSEGWYDPERHGNDPNVDWSSMIWRAERKIENGAYSGNWVISRIKGERGSSGGDLYLIKSRNDNAVVDDLVSDTSLENATLTKIAIKLNNSFITEQCRFKCSDNTIPNNLLVLYRSNNSGNTVYKSIGNSFIESSSTQSSGGTNIYITNNTDNEPEAWFRILTVSGLDTTLIPENYYYTLDIEHNKGTLASPNWVSIGTKTFKLSVFDISSGTDNGSFYTLEIIDDVISYNTEGTELFGYDSGLYVGREPSINIYKNNLRGNTELVELINIESKNSISGTPSSDILYIEISGVDSSTNNSIFSNIQDNSNNKLKLINSGSTTPLIPYNKLGYDVTIYKYMLTGVDSSDNAIYGFVWQDSEHIDCSKDTIGISDVLPYILDLYRITSDNSSASIDNETTDSGLLEDATKLRINIYNGSSLITNSCKFLIIDKNLPQINNNGSLGDLLKIKYSNDDSNYDDMSTTAINASNNDIYFKLDKSSSMPNNYVFNLGNDRTKYYHYILKVLYNDGTSDILIGYITFRLTISDISAGGSFYKLSISNLTLSYNSIGRSNNDPAPIIKVYEIGNSESTTKTFIPCETLPVSPDSSKFYVVLNTLYDSTTYGSNEISNANSGLSLTYNLDTYNAKGYNILLYKGNLYCDDLNLYCNRDLSYTAVSGYTSITLRLYKRSNTGSAPDTPSNSSYCDLSNGKLYSDSSKTTEITGNTSLNGWFINSANAGSTGQLYLTTAPAFGQANTTDEIASNEWSTPISISEDGVTPDPNIATIFLYLRSSTNLTRSNLPGNRTYYFNGNPGAGLSSYHLDFVSNETNNTYNGWTEDIPLNDVTIPLWFTHATASSVTDSDTILATEWSDPQQFVPGITIPQQSEGKTGKMFYMMGVWDSTTEYKIDDLKIPVVFYDDGEVNNSGNTGHYYYLNPETEDNSNLKRGTIDIGNGVSKGDIPKSAKFDHDGNNSTANIYVWLRADDFGLVITEGIFSEFAKLGSAVISGDYMFSQHGKVICDNNSTTINSSNTDFNGVVPYTLFNREELTIDYDVYLSFVPIANQSNSLGNIYLIKGKTYKYSYSNNTGKTSLLLSIRALGSTSGTKTSFISINNSSALNSETSFGMDTGWYTLYISDNLLTSNSPDVQGKFIFTIDKQPEFKPNWCVDLKTGKMIAGLGNFVVNPDGSINIGNNNFTVDTSGNINILGNLTSGSNISGASITGGTMNIGRGNLVVDANGNVTINGKFKYDYSIVKYTTTLDSPAYITNTDDYYILDSNLTNVVVMLPTPSTSINKLFTVINRWNGTITFAVNDGYNNASEDEYIGYYGDFSSGNANYYAYNSNQQSDAEHYGTTTKSKIVFWCDPNAVVSNNTASPHWTILELSNF